MEVDIKEIAMALRVNKIHSAKCPKGISERYNRTADEGHEEPIANCKCWVEEDMIIIVNR